MINYDNFDCGVIHEHGHIARVTGMTTAGAPRLKCAELAEGLHRLVIFL